MIEYNSTLIKFIYLYEYAKLMNIYLLVSKFTNIIISNKVIVQFNLKFQCLCFN